MTCARALPYNFTLLKLKLGAKEGTMDTATATAATSLPPHVRLRKRRRQPSLPRPNLDNRKYAARLATKVEKAGVFEGGVSCLADNTVDGARSDTTFEGWADGVGNGLECEGWANTSCLPTRTRHWAATTGHRMVRGWFSCGAEGASSLAFKVVCGTPRGTLVITHMRSYTRNWGRVRVDVVAGDQAGNSTATKVLASRVSLAGLGTHLLNTCVLTKVVLVNWTAHPVPNHMHATRLTLLACKCQMR